MPTLKFKIGDAFPADDTVARFVTVVAMMSNDWLREMRHMLAIGDKEPDAPGMRVMSFRRQAAAYHEATEFMVDARRLNPDVGTFLVKLGEDAKQAYKQFVGGSDPKSEHYAGDWIAGHRHVTNHYPVMHPARAAAGKEEITNALEAAADIESTITADDTFGSVRFNFADEVAVQWLPDAQDEQALRRGRRAR